MCITISNHISILAHEKMLNVEYDQCTPSVPRDEADEIWYWLIWKNSEYHISHEEITIKYYFASNSEYDSNYSWITDIYKEYTKTMSEEEALVQAKITAEQIKQSYADRMKKWNDIYYYSYDEKGNSKI